MQIESRVSKTYQFEDILKQLTLNFWEKIWNSFWNIDIRDRKIFFAIYSTIIEYISNKFFYVFQVRIWREIT